MTWDSKKSEGREIITEARTAEDAVFIIDFNICRNNKDSTGMQISHVTRVEAVGVSPDVLSNP